MKNRKRESCTSGGDHIVGCYHNTRGLWAIAYNPRKNALYVPFQDQCLSMTQNRIWKLQWPCRPRRFLVRRSPAPPLGRPLREHHRPPERRSGFPGWEDASYPLNLYLFTSWV
jgi:hypothetical protein